MKHLIPSLVCAILVIGCGGAQSSASQSNTGQSEDPNATASCVAPSEPPSAETCGYVVRGCCYTTAALACQAAGCSEESCTILESFPAQVSCR
jgi:hypothetical protein